MSNRESRLSPVALTSIGGINERDYFAELKPHEYVSQQGLFPEFSGLQSRLWGKRTLAKYANPIYGIYQFWTPMGYGVGLYQFDGNLDYGVWITPTSSFDLTPVDLGVDLGNYTLDEFGLPYGYNFGISEENSCVLSFLNGGMDHTSCIPPPTNINTPNDSNGGPAGQGKSCSIAVEVNDYDLADFASLQENGGYSNQSVNQVDQDNCRNPADGLNPPCVNFPPLPLALVAIPDVTGYVSSTVDGVLTASKSAHSEATFNPATHPFCTFRVTVNQINNATNRKITINLTPFIGDDIDSITLVLTKTPGGEIEIPLVVSLEDQILNANDYLTLGSPVANGNGGYDQSGSVTSNTIRTRKRKRVCV